MNVTLAALAQSAATPASPEPFRFTPGEIRVFRIPEKISTAEWAALHRTVVDGGRKSPWRNELSPCAAGIMDALDLPYVREVYVQAPPQSVKTQAFLNYLLRRIDQAPTSAMIIMPDEKLTKRIIRRRIKPSILASPRTAAVMSPRADDTTNISIAFINGMDITGAWAGSASSMSSDAMEVVMFDEMNKHPAPTGSEPDSFHQGRARTNSFPYTYKIYGGSTPTDTAGLISNVIKTRADEVRYYHAKCPICGDEQRMLWENISWGKSRDPREVLRKRLAVYHCRACGMAWDDAMRDKAVLSMMKTGWRRDENDESEPVERPRVIAFKLQSWYVQSMSEAAAAFLDGQNDPEKLKAWVTQHCAEEWEERYVKKTENAVLQRRSIYPALIVPPEAIALTAGVDVQARCFWFVVRAWAEDLTSWLIQYGQLMSWADVENLIYRTAYRIHDSQNTMGIWRAGIDTGGGESVDGDWSRTEEIYQWLRSQPSRAAAKVFGTKGATHLRGLFGKRIKVSRIDTMPSTNKLIPGGLELRLLDTTQYKGLIHFRLERKEATEDKPAESQRFYLHADTQLDYVKQLLSEEWRPDRKKVMHWKQVYHANHLLDCEVIAAACADMEWLPSLKMLAAYLKNPGASAGTKRRVISNGVE
jgi:phage terminase large subunit GpA-like protein